MFKHCHRCGQEFQSWVSVCPDCNVPLDLAPGETPATAEPPRSSAPLEDPVLLKLGEPWELRELAESLQQHGISSQIDSHPLGAAMSASQARSRGQPVQLGIYVRRADVAAVREFADEFASSELSDDGEYGVADPGTCPACSEPTPENAAACAACGLEFPELPTS